MLISVSQRHSGKAMRNHIDMMSPVSLLLILVFASPMVSSRPEMLTKKMTEENHVDKSQNAFALLKKSEDLENFFTQKKRFEHLNEIRESLNTIQKLEFNLQHFEFHSSPEIIREHFFHNRRKRESRKFHPLNFFFYKIR